MEPQIAELLRFNFTEDGVFLKVSHWFEDHPDYSEITQTVIEQIAPMLMAYANTVGDPLLTEKDRFTNAMSDLMENPLNHGSLILMGTLTDDGVLFDWEIPDEDTDRVMAETNPIKMFAEAAWFCFNTKGEDWDE